ncbi:hypothetical protein Tco_0212411 [Tanacetum coccineum]
MPEIAASKRASLTTPLPGYENGEIQRLTGGRYASSHGLPPAIDTWDQIAVGLRSSRLGRIKHVDFSHWTVLDTRARDPEPQDAPSDTGAAQLKMLPTRRATRTTPATTTATTPTTTVTEASTQALNDQAYC